MAILWVRTHADHIANGLLRNQYLKQHDLFYILKIKKALQKETKDKKLMTKINCSRNDIVNNLYENPFRSH